MDNILTLPNGRVAIFNGGNPIKDCPKSFEEAEIIEAKLNVERTDYECFPEWKFDYLTKLDFDGSILEISSRFYAPASHYGDKWDGNCDIYLMGIKIKSKSFECETLNELTQSVEKYAITCIEKIKNLLSDIQLDD